jgi:hypothetical protein
MLEIASTVIFCYVASLIMLVMRKLAGDPNAKAQSEDIFFKGLGFSAMFLGGLFLFKFLFGVSL